MMPTEVSHALAKIPRQSRPRKVTFPKLVLAVQCHFSETPVLGSDCGACKYGELYCIVDV
jgi:hypothetical protein